jgi:ComF family protein
MTASKFLKPIIDFLLPPQCPLCFSMAVDTNITFCATCWQKIEWINDPICTTCGYPSPFEGSHIACTHCTGHIYYDCHRSVVLYNEAIKPMILNLKHNDQTQYAKHMAHYMVSRYKDLTKSFDIVLPVPLHNKRLRTRNYNQAGLIASHVSNLLNVPVDYQSLSRVRNTNMQGKGSLSRYENVANAFALEKSFLHKNIILIDDVYTTGATINEISKTLKTHGVEKIISLTFARAQINKEHDIK